MSDESESPNRNDRPLPSAWTKNPYQAPTAHVEDARREVDDSLTSEPNSVGAGRGAGWWSDGWRLFREATGTWILIGIVLAVLNLVMGLIPVVGNLATSLLFPVFGAGLMFACHAIDSGEEASLGHLFGGFQNGFGRLVMVGVLYLLGTLAIFAVAMLAGFGSGFAAKASGAGVMAMFSGLGVGILAAVALAVPLGMAVWFAPVLVGLHGLSAFEAMKLSFRGCLRNFLPFLIYGLVFIVLAILATVPVGLGWLVLFPVMFCSTYASYRDIFTPQ